MEGLRASDDGLQYELLMFPATSAFPALVRPTGGKRVGLAWLLEPTAAVVEWVAMEWELQSTGHMGCGDTTRRIVQHDQGGFAYTVVATGTCTTSAPEARLQLDKLFAANVGNAGRRIQLNPVMSCVHTAVLSSGQVSSSVGDLLLRAHGCLVNSPAEGYLGSSPVVTLPRSHFGPGLDFLRTKFSNAARYGCTTLEVVLKSPSDLAFCLSVVKEQMPFLRHLRITCYDGAVLDWKALLIAATVSLFLETIRIADAPPPTAELVLALATVSHRNDDEHTPVSVTFLRDAPIVLLLRRGQALMPIKSAFPMPSFEPTLGDVNLRFRDTTVAVRRSCLRFSPVLTHWAEAPSEVDKGKAATEFVLALEETFTNVDGDEESENRFSTVDVRLVALWLNEYANDEVHEALQKSGAPKYHVSLMGQHFYDTHINKSKNSDVALKRCISLLALSHLLNLTTLETLLVSIIASAL